MKKLFITIFSVICILTACQQQNNLMTNNTSTSSISPTEQMIETYETGDTMTGSNHKLSVNGFEITIEGYDLINIQGRYANIPLMQTVKALGATVEWNSETIAIIRFNGNCYVLDMSQNSVVELGKSSNIIAPPPGTPHESYFQIIDGDFIVDSDSARKFIKLLGATIKIDYSNTTVYIDPITY